MGLRAILEDCYHSVWAGVGISLGDLLFPSPDQINNAAQPQLGIEELGIRGLGMNLWRVLGVVVVMNRGRKCLSIVEV